MRVLSLLWGFSLGGISKYALNLNGMNRYENLDLSIETACIYGKDWECDLTSLYELDAHLIQIRDRTDLSWISVTSILIDKLKPDLLLVHGFNGPVIAQICKLFCHHSFEVVCTYHGLYSAPKFSRRPMVPLFNYLQEWLYKRKAKAILSVCEHSKRYLIEQGVPSGKLTTIHNGIDPADISGDRCSLRSEFGYEETDFLIGCASRLDPAKGLNYLIDAVPNILDEVPHAKFVIFGNGVSEQDLIDQCSRLKVSHAVNFAGYRSDVPQMMGALDLFVFPTLAESHSIGLLEAMRAGLSIVATDVGGNPESIIDGISGLLVPPGDVAALVTASIACAKDQDLRVRIGMGARRRFEAEFTFDKHLRRTANWLLSCAD